MRLFGPGGWIEDITTREAAQMGGLAGRGRNMGGRLDDIHGDHLKNEHVYAALDGAVSGPVAEGSVDRGSGMVCHQFKVGIIGGSLVGSAVVLACFTDVVFTRAGRLPW